MASTKAVGGSTVRSTIAFASISIFLMVAPALATAYFGLGIFTVMSESMKPYMAAGDEIVTDVVSAHDVRVGDVILFVQPESLEQTSHRVVHIIHDNRNYTITTQGDANPAVDTPALTYNTNAPIRRVIAVVPKIGFVLDVVSSTATKTFGSVALIGYLVYLIRKTRRKVEASKPSVAATLSDAEIAARVESLVRAHLSSTSSTFVPASTTSPTQNQNNRADIYL